MPTFYIQLGCLFFGVPLAAWFGLQTAVHGNPYQTAYRLIWLEALVLLLVINGPYFFKDFLEPHQLVSWGLMIYGIFFFFWAVSYLASAGEFAGGVNISDRYFEDGPYRLVRHPMSAAVMVFAVSIMLKHVTLASFLLTVVCVVGVALGAKARSLALEQQYHGKFDKYFKKTKAFFPYIL